MEKYTIAVRFDEVIAFLREHDAEEKLIKFIAERKEQHTKKNGSRKSAKDDVNNIALAKAIEEYLLDVGEPKAVAEINNECEACKELSNQKVTSLLKMVNGIAKDVIKGKPMYFIKGE